MLGWVGRWVGGWVGGWVDPFSIPLVRILITPALDEWVGGWVVDLSSFSPLAIQIHAPFKSPLCAFSVHRRSTATLCSAA